MADNKSVAARRKEAVARFLDAAKWVGGDFGFKVSTPPANADVELQRISLIEYGASVLEAVRESRQAERQTQAEAAKAERAAKREAREAADAKADKADEGKE